MNSHSQVCLLGFGEVGQALAQDLRGRVARLTAWDLKFPDPDSAPVRAAADLGVHSAGDVRTAVAGAELVICAVTAAQTVAAARSAAAHLRRGAFFFDLNSVSPHTRQQAADIIDSAGGRFVEAAIMSPILPQRTGSPMLLAGTHAGEFMPLARELGFGSAAVFSEKLGAASAAKMCRSVIVKGMEALLLESLITARSFGVEAAVIESLQAMFSGKNWQEQGRYMISRALIHGRRRAEEMREVARTVTEAGLAPRMSGACAEWQEWAGMQAGAPNEDLGPMLDTLLAASAQGRAPC